MARLRLREGQSLADALRQQARMAPGTTFWVRAFGALGGVELRGPSAGERVRWSDPCTLLGLEGVVTRAGGEVELRLVASVATGSPLEPGLIAGTLLDALADDVEVLMQDLADAPDTRAGAAQPSTPQAAASPPRPSGTLQAPAAPVGASTPSAPASPWSMVAAASAAVQKEAASDEIDVDDLKRDDIIVHPDRRLGRCRVVEVHDNDMVTVLLIAARKMRKLKLSAFAILPQGDTREFLLEKRSS